MMDARVVYLGRERHADNFADRELVFDADGISVVVMQWNDKGRKTFEVFVDGFRVGSTSNYLKAIGMGVYEKQRKEVAYESL